MDWQKLSAFPIENIAHVASVVPDLDRAMKEIGAQLGATWAEPQCSDSTLTFPDGPHTTRAMRVTYSLQGPPYLELLEGSQDPKSIWYIGDGPRFHHLGIYVADWRGETRRLEALGMIVEAIGSGMSYVRDPMGVRYELMSWKGKDLVYNWLHGAPDHDRFQKGPSQI
ncbi:MAG: VOC family protein [Gammaproteobacteria bacterium]